MLLILDSYIILCFIDLKKVSNLLRVKYHLEGPNVKNRAKSLSSIHP